MGTCLVVSLLLNPFDCSKCCVKVGDFKLLLNPMKSDFYAPLSMMVIVVKLICIKWSLFRFSRRYDLWVAPM